MWLQQPLELLCWDVLSLKLQILCNQGSETICIASWLLCLYFHFCLQAERTVKGCPINVLILIGLVECREVRCCSQSIALPKTMAGFSSWQSPFSFYPNAGNMLPQLTNAKFKHYMDHSYKSPYVSAISLLMDLYRFGVVQIQLAYCSFLPETG